MRTEDLMDRLAAYGADMNGIGQRFDGDAEFYGACLSIFLEDRNFALLGQALAAGDLQAAFTAAHSLKGTAANMGLTPMSAPVCALVEALRTGETEGLDARYAAVLAALDRLRAV